MASRQKARHKSPHFINAILKIISKIDLTKLVGFLRNHTQKIRPYLQKLKPYLPKSKSFILGLLLLSAFSFVTLAAILPGTHIFEGNLIFQEMSFTYNGELPKLFIGNIKYIKELENQGIQTLTFTGNFQSQSLPQLNQLNSLQIQLTDRESKLIITPANADVTSEITLEELRIQPQTKVTGLNYDFYRQQLAFSLLPNSQINQTSSNTLKIYLGGQPIKVILEGYKIPSLNLPKQQDETTQLEFIVNPNNKEFQLELKQNTNVYITLSQPPKPESEQWFRGKIATKDVRFIRVDRNGGDLRDELEVSTIIEGKIRMAEQEKEIKDDQFLMGENPNQPLNIQLIRNLQIIPEKKGIEARFSGTTKQIQIGLDKDFPVSRIRGSWLDGVLPRDAIIALFSFGAATIANLLPWLFSNTSKSDADNQ
ncbi:hypothetical protein [Nostoc parmelioides]|uniref:Uncharacterized protein n=1 Tax=Nostoc parmelioides FACHB-3921 TaxID=2692909 RepID=A0ABR8BIT2_9NOSO|nr:hypothetical protein [Nostoc parmelioides]MBD2254022.1 hypothetical protein [Nostoc parmelioides FACHB-3921]